MPRGEARICRFQSENIKVEWADEIDQAWPGAAEDMLDQL